MKITGALFTFRPNSRPAPAVPAAVAETQAVVSDSLSLAAPQPLESVIIAPRFAAFVPLDATMGTIRCANPAALKERAGRLEVAGIRLIGVRHGESQANANGGGAILSGRGDSPLTDKGQQQAREAAARVYEQLGGEAWLRQAAVETDRLPVLVASPLSRAYDTAQALQQLLQNEAQRLQVGPLVLPIEKDPDLQEIDFGHCEGADARGVAQAYPNFGKGTDFLHRFPGGESGMDTIARVDRFLDKVEREHTGRTVVFFAHTMSLGLSRVLLGETEHDAAGRMLVDRSKLPNATPIQLTHPAPLKESLDGWYLK